MVKLAKILVFDDEPDIAELYLQKFRNEIENEEYFFSFAITYDDVLSTLQETDYDIFISDINVSNVDFLELIKVVKEKYPLLKCIVVSAYGDINTLRFAMRGGAHDFVTKPINLSDLSKTIYKTAHVVKELKRNKENEKKLTAIKDELDVSAKLQRSILPGNVLQSPNIELYADTKPAAEVGGDFYDFFWLNDYTLGIVMADVSGKNISAALFMTMTRTLLKSFSRLSKSPSECLQRVNDSLVNENVTTMFVTTLYGNVDIRTGVLTYCNAGHLPIGLIHPKKEVKFLECDFGIALGIADGIDFIDNVHQLENDDIILLYTDGVTEAADPEGGEYDYERFTKLLEQNKNEMPEKITEQLLISIQKFADIAPQSDDITTLCMKFIK